MRIVIGERVVSLARRRRKVDKLVRRRQIVRVLAAAMAWSWFWKTNSSKATAQTNLSAWRIVANSAQ